MAFKSKVLENIGISSGPSVVSPTVINGTTATIIGFSLANTLSVAITVTAKLIKADASVAHMVKNATVVPGGAIVVVGGDQKTVLEAGDSIIAYSSVSNSADSIMSYLV